MRTVCIRYNSQKLVEVLKRHMATRGFACGMSLSARWQVSVVDGNGYVYDYFFTVKPTRKQIRKCVRG